MKMMTFLFSAAALSAASFATATAPVRLESKTRATTVDSAFLRTIQYTLKRTAPCSTGTRHQPRLSS